MAPTRQTRWPAS